MGWVPRSHARWDGPWLDRCERCELLPLQVEGRAVLCGGEGGGLAGGRGQGGSRCTPREPHQGGAPRGAGETHLAAEGRCLLCPPTPKTTPSPPRVRRRLTGPLFGWPVHSVVRCCSTSL